MFIEHKEVGEVQPFKLGTLKMSDAIRKGAAKRSQCRTALFEGGGSCALGAMYEAVYGHPGDSRKGFPSLHDGQGDDAVIGQRLCKAFPQLDQPLGQDTVLHAIYRMNDFDRKSREQIADWLEARGL